MAQVEPIHNGLRSFDLVAVCPGNIDVNSPGALLETIIGVVAGNQGVAYVSKI